MLYVPVLFLHSFMRWLVLLLCTLTLLGALRGVLTGRAAGRIEQRIGWLMVLCVDLQLLLGLLLYLWLSPLPAAAFRNLRAAMKIAPLRFFGIEHGTTMLLFVLGVHLTRVLARRRATPRGRHGVTAVGLLLSLGLALAAIPWPGRPYGRPYLRTQRHDRAAGSAAMASVVRGVEGGSRRGWH